MPSLRKRSYTDPNKWPRDHAGKHSDAAKKGWASRIAGKVFKRYGSEYNYRYNIGKGFATQKERQAVEVAQKAKQKLFTEQREQLDKLYNRLREAEKAGKPTKRLERSIFTLRKKHG